METKGHSGNRLQELDGLRGLAALAVVLFHYTWRYPDLVPGGAGLPYGLPWGKYGVELFFGISGFVIFMTLRRSETAAQFVISRFSRLFPAYWTAIFATTMVLWIADMTQFRVSARDIAMNFTMLQNHFLMPEVDSAYWSLGIELSFYAIMLAIWRLRWLDHIEGVLCGWIGLKFLWWLVPSMPWIAGFWLIVDYIPFFAIGILSYRVWSGERRWRQQLPYLALALLAVSLIDPAPLKYVFLASLTCFFLLSQGHLALLHARPLLWLGGISYTLYLVHQNIGYAIMSALEHQGHSPWLATASALVLSLGLAHLISTWIERPALRGIRTMWRTINTPARTT